MNRRRIPAALFALAGLLGFGILPTAIAQAGNLSAGSGSASAIPVLSTSPGISPRFDWNQHDYAVRCENQAIAVSLAPPAGWHSRVGSRATRAGSYQVKQNLRSDRAFSVLFSKGQSLRKRYWIRCLPTGFPPYRLQRFRPGGPRLTMIEMSRYAVAFDRAGVPVWWFLASGDVNNAQFMDDGTFSYAPVNGFYSREFMIHRLDGKLVRKLEVANGLLTDVHDLIRLPNGNYMLGARRLVDNVDTSRFGGSPSATITTTQIQELSPSGRLVWKWNSWPRIGLGQTGRWWKTLVAGDQPYDVHHWNSVDRRGNRILLSFRHLDALLLIDRRSGRIRWKLGGVKTSKSLKIRKDPRRRYPLGGQHDARFAADGSVTVLDNSTGLANPQPRAVRYRIGGSQRTATMVKQVLDPDVGFSLGFASASLFGNDQWVVGWGATGRKGIVTGFTREGKIAYRLITPFNVSYRANAVTGGSPTVAQLRRAMNRMAARQG